MKGNPSVVGSFTADFLHDGNPSIPYKWNDLFIWPQDIQPLNNGGATPYSSYFVADSASPTGGEFIMAQNAGYGQFQQYLYGGGNGQLNVTKNLPAIQMTLYFSAKCPSGQTSFTFLAGIFGGSYTNTQSYSCTTSLQTYSLVQDLVGQTTGYFYFENTSAFSIYLAWAALVPTPNFRQVQRSVEIQLGRGRCSLLVWGTSRLCLLLGSYTNYCPCGYLQSVKRCAECRVCRAHEWSGCPYLPHSRCCGYSFSVEHLLLAHWVHAYRPNNNFERGESYGSDIQFHNRRDTEHH